MKKTFKIVLCWLCAGSFGGCSAHDSVGSVETEPASTRLPIENGELLPTMASTGVVLLMIPAAGSNFNVSYCTGQVIAKDAVLTAAHCFTQAGHGAGTVNVNIRHQRTNGEWMTLATVGRVFMHENFVAGGSPALDVAVVRTNPMPVSIDSVAALHADEMRKFTIGHAYGHGFHSDDDLDQNLRRGEMNELTYSSQDRLINTAYGDSDPHVCQGDSGGPLKLNFDYDGMDGLQFGISIKGGGTPYCLEDSAKFVNIPQRLPWIRRQIEDSGPRCTEKTYTQGSVKAILCW